MLTMFDDRSVTEIADHDMKMFEEIRMEEQKEIHFEYVDEKNSPAPHHKAMLKNLQDVFSFIQSQPFTSGGPIDDNQVIRPIKINSPQV